MTTTRTAAPSARTHRRRAAAPNARTHRRRAVLALLAVVAAGLALQLVRHLPGTDVAGTALYAAAAVLAVAALAPRLPVWAAATAGTGAACAVEVAQLTALPGWAAQAVPGARLLLGTSFDPVDLLVLLAAGGLTGAALLAGRRGQVTAASRTRRARRSA